MGIFDLYKNIEGPEGKEKRFNGVTDEGERVRKLIAGDPNKFLHTNGS